MIDITRALAIPGWMSPEELTWLAGQAPPRATILEVGSFCGRSTRALADHMAPVAVLYAIDPWQSDWSSPTFPVEQRDPRAYSLIKAHPNPGIDFCRNLLDHIIDRRVIPVMGSLADFPLSGDLIFLDGNHTRAFVEQDIKHARERLTYGGLLCGHDYHSDIWPDVTAAVDEMLGPAVKVIEGTSIWTWRNV